MIININGEDINVVILYKKNNKNIYFRYKDNSLYISTPVINKNEIIRIIERNKDNIHELILKSKLKDEISSNTIHYLGKEYILDIIESNENNVYLTIDKLVVKTKSINSDYVKKLIRNFYTANIKEYVLANFKNLYNNYKDLLYLGYPRLVFKYTTSFYGKCYPKKHEILFSGMCMKLDPKYIDCIINHEICHLKYLGHQDDFYLYFENHFKNAKKTQHEFRSLKYKDKY